MEQSKTKYKSKSKQLMDIGKMPPQAIEIEEAVIGALMLQSEIASIVFTILKHESFYKDAHSLMFAACERLYTQSYPIDILTVTQELMKAGELELAGGAYNITKLTNKIGSAANIEFHARIIQQKFIQRELIRVSTQTIHDAYEDGCEVFDLLDQSGKNLFLITQNTYKKGASTSASIANKVIKELEATAKRVDGLSGIPAGIQSLDKLTGGWQNGDLIIVAARPAMGKTALAVTLGKNAAMMFSKPTAIFSLEMTESQLMRRIISSEAKINSYLLKNPKNLTDENWKEINTAIGDISNAPLFIDDTPGMSIFELRAKARRMKEENGIELIIIDYLQLMTAGMDKGNREQEISLISRSLKGLAKELQIPVIALSQLSRAVESRPGSKEPQLSDLRESGAIEQDADMVIFPHRPEYYNIMEDEAGNSTVGMAKLIIAKHREGAIGDAYTRYISYLTTFCDIEERTEKSAEDLPF